MVVMEGWAWEVFIVPVSDLRFCFEGWMKGAWIMGGFERAGQQSEWTKRRVGGLR